MYAPVDGRGFAYERCAKGDAEESAAERSIVVMNPGVNNEYVSWDCLAGLSANEANSPVLKVGEISCTDSSLVLGAQSFAIFSL